jgi:hypothetical protein
MKMATSKKSVKNPAKKPAKKSAVNARKARAKEAVKGPAPKQKSAGKQASKAAGTTGTDISIKELKDLRSSLKLLATTPRDMTAAEVGKFATDAFTVLDFFLQQCDGVGGGSSDQKIRVIGD